MAARRAWQTVAGVGLALGFLAALLAAGSAPLADFIGAQVQKAVRQAVVWQPDSPQVTADRYLGDNLPPLHMSFRFFNITNVEAVRKGAKPVLQEVGPYTFGKTRKLQSVEFVHGNASVRYHPYEYHLFEPRRSNGSMDDLITTLNVPLIGALETIQAVGGRARPLLALLAGWVEGWGDKHVQGLFHTRTVGELLWGYEDALLAQLAKWAPRLGVKLKIDPWIKLVYNMTSPEQADAGLPIQSATGADDIARVWQTEEWGNVSEVRCWGEGHVEPVRGPDAMQFRPGLKVGDRVPVWMAQYFRATHMLATEEVELGGIKLLRLRSDPADAAPDPRFFQTLEGLFNLTSPMACQMGPGLDSPPGPPGPPVFLAPPHFCGADPSLPLGVEGLQCRPEYTDNYLDIEPNTGVTVRAAQRLMMVSWFGGRWRVIDGKAADTFLPIFWIDVASQARPSDLEQFTPLKYALAAQAALRQWGRPAGGVLALAATVLLVAAAVLYTPAAAEAEAGGYEQLDAGEQQQQRRRQAGQQQQPTAPVSFPVAADGAALESPA